MEMEIGVRIGDRRRTHLPRVRILVIYISTTYVLRWRTYFFLTCVRICLAYVVSDVRILWLRVPVTYAVCLAYVFRWRTCLPATCVSTHVLYPRTYSIHVRMLSTYVLYPRTCSTDVRVLSMYAFRDRDSGLRSRAGFGTTESNSRIRKYAISGLRSRNHGFGTTLDSEYAEYSGFWIWLKKIAVDLLGL